jgi:hypothetical protein
MFQLQLFFLLHCEGMGPRCSSAKTQVCHRSYIIAATCACAVVKDKVNCLFKWLYLLYHGQFYFDHFQNITWF